LGCHLGVPVGDRIRLSLDGGIVYRPGDTHLVTIEILDRHNLHGFQLTARFAQDPLAMAGSFSQIEDEAVRCGSLDLTVDIARTGTSCPSNAPLEYIGHDFPIEMPRFRVRWTAPAAGGDVVFYAAGNAANGDTTRSGDRIHATQLRVTTAGPPQFTAASVVLATAFPGGRAISPQAWVEIYGERLAQSLATWDSAIATGMAPTQLGGVRVTVAGRPAFLSYVSMGQINIQVPDGVPPGLSSITIQTPLGESSQAVTTDAASPGILAPATFRISGRQYTAAQHPDGAFVGPAGFFGAGIPSRSARPGDRILLWAIGLGPVSPAQQAGRVVTQPNALGAFALRFGTRAVATEYAGLAPGAIGLFQLNAVVPDLEPADYEIGGSVAAGIPLPSGIFVNLR
jgi:uncharacterized protein (TIGR03437 family)